MTFTRLETLDYSFFLTKGLQHRKPLNKPKKRYNPKLHLKSTDLVWGVGLRDFKSRPPLMSIPRCRVTPCFSSKSVLTLSRIFGVSVLKNPFFVDLVYRVLLDSPRWVEKGYISNWGTQSRTWGPRSLHRIKVFSDPRWVFPDRSCRVLWVGYVTCNSEGTAPQPRPRLDSLPTSLTSSRTVVKGVHSCPDPHNRRWFCTTLYASFVFSVYLFFKGLLEISVTNEISLQRKTFLDPYSPSKFDSYSKEGLRCLLVNPSSIPLLGVHVPCFVSIDPRGR